MMIRVRVTGRLTQNKGDETSDLYLSRAQVLSEQQLSDADGERYLRWFEGPSPGPFFPSR